MFKIAGIAVLSLLVLLGGAGLVSYISTRQTYIGFETDIQAQDKELLS